MSQPRRIDTRLPRLGRGGPGRGGSASDLGQLGPQPGPAQSPGPGTDVARWRLGGP